MAGVVKAAQGRDVVVWGVVEVVRVRCSVDMQNCAAAGTSMRLVLVHSVWRCCGRSLLDPKRYSHMTSRSLRPLQLPETYSLAQARAVSATRS